jgi:hypothetical protein
VTVISGSQLPTIPRAKQDWKAIHTPILGVVLNKLRDEEQASYYYQYAEAQKSSQKAGGRPRSSGSVAPASSPPATVPDFSDT